MIAAQDIAIRSAAQPVAPALAAPAVAFRERLLLVVLYITVLASSVAFIEPSPHDGLMCVLAVVCVAAGIRFDRHLALLFLLLLVWNVGGLLSLLNVPGQEQTAQYAATSLYLALAAMLFAALFSHNTMARIVTVRAAYVLTATVVSVAAIAGYFNLFPYAHELFATYDRALGAFKDPNVFGPFLIWPALVVIERMLARRIVFTDAVIVGIMLLGLLLSFSRGAWFHFSVSCLIVMILTYSTARSDGARKRIFTVSAIAVAAIAAFVVIALSFDSIASMFDQRAQLIQYYDVGSGGRFRLQELALAALLKYPNGMGPFGFSRAHGGQQHNVYLQAFLVYGWAGGMAYIMLMLTTLWVALRNVLVHTPWQPYLICAFGAFVGEVLEGFVIDTDHWRHFFLIAGHDLGLGGGDVKFDAPASIRCRQDGSLMSALDSSPTAGRRGAAPCGACGSACLRTLAARFCSMSAASSRRFPTPTRKADCPSPSPACFRPRAVSAKARALAYTALEAAGYAPAAFDLSPAFGQVELNDATQRRTSARFRQSDRPSQRTLFAARALGARACARARPPHRRLLGLGVAAAARRMAREFPLPARNLGAEQLHPRRRRRRDRQASTCGAASLAANGRNARHARQARPVGRACSCSTCSISAPPSAARIRSPPSPRFARLTVTRLIVCW